MDEIHPDKAFVSKALWRASAVLSVIALSALVSGFMLGLGLIWPAALVLLVTAIVGYEAFNAYYDGAVAMSLLGEIMARIAVELEVMDE